MDQSGTELFQMAFQDNTSYTMEWGEFLFRVHDLQYLSIATGEMVICDPLEMTHDMPFIVSIPPGCYPIKLSVAHREQQEKVAFAKLMIHPEAPIYWDKAMVYAGFPKQRKSVAEMTESELDMCVGSIMDIRAFYILSKQRHADPSYAWQLVGQMRQQQSSWANICIDRRQQLNAILFSSGLGERVYATYFGYDAKDRLVSVLMDFYVIPWDTKF